MCRKVEKLDVIVPIFNPIGFKSRNVLADQFIEYMESNPRVRLHIIELARGDQKFQHTHWWHPRHTQIRSDDVLWYKENLINIVIKNLPKKAKYVAWIDADVKFVREDWAEATIEGLKRWAWVQMFSQAADLGPKGETIILNRGFVWCKYHDAKQMARQMLPKHVSGKIAHSYAIWHPGYAWAARRDVLDRIGGVMDFTVLGSADHHMAFALIGKIQEALKLGNWAGIWLNPNYTKALLDWETKIRQEVKHIGYIPGTLFHYWHGSKRKRQYAERNVILSQFQFDPTRDVYYNEQGLIQFADPSNPLHDAVKDFFTKRDEDSDEA